MIVLQQNVNQGEQIQMQTNIEQLRLNKSCSYHLRIKNLLNLYISKYDFNQRTESAVIVIFFQYIVMQALAAHLKRKNLKLLEQQLSLPKIEEKGFYHPPQTSAKSRKAKLSPLKYVSETTLSPEQEHIQDQIRLILQKTPAKNYSQPLKMAEITEVKQRSESQLKQIRLPKINESNIDSDKSQNQNGSRKDFSEGRKSRTNNSKFDLDSIFKDKDSFIQSYFAQIKAKTSK